jgi:hypothetical protein
MRKKLLVGLGPLAVGAVLALPTAPAQAAPTPEVTKVEPNFGPASGGTSVTITGTNFKGVTAVDFGSKAAASFTVNSETSITAVSPAKMGTMECAGGPGSGCVDVTVTTPAGTSPVNFAADGFRYGPTVTKLEPAALPRSGGTSVMITGRNFSQVTAVYFSYPTHAASFTVNSETSITAVTPKRLEPGSVAVTTAGGFGGGPSYTVTGLGHIFFINDTSLTTTRRPILSFGAITLHDSAATVTCQTVQTEQVFNETTEGAERGFLNTLGYSTYECQSEVKCKVKNTKGEEVEGIYLTAEAPPKGEGTEAHLTGISSLPWTGELIEREEGRQQVLMKHVKLWVVFPPASVGTGPGCVGTEIEFEDAEGKTEKEEGYELASLWINGAHTTPLKPSHNEFLEREGETEKGFPITGRLRSPQVGDGFLRATKLVLGGMGGAWELVTAET